jgi:C-terminal processing protease CtpA/Prc
MNYLLFLSATVPISDLTNHGYDLHDIKLMQASEEIPVGFKLTKQNDPLQYLITVVVEQSKADEAGLKIDDWIIKIEDNDIRLTDLHDVSHDIHQLLNNQGYINMLIARKKPSTLSILIDDPRSSAITYDLPAEKNILLSVGLSNRIEEESTKSLSTDDYSVIQYEPINKDKIRYITLKEAAGLYFDSFIPDNKNPTHQLHFIKNIQPISMSYRSGLRNNDRIIAVNNTDVTHMKHDDVRALIIKKQPVELTVVNDPKTVELIEKYKTNQKRMTCSSLIYESIEQQSNNLSKDLENVLFIDDYGPIYMKHCVIKKDTDYNVLGFLLHYIDNVHVVGNVEENYPAYNNGLRNDDVILFINNQNIELMTHNDVTMLLRSLVQSNEIVDLILINKTDVERYKNYKEKSFINWKNILEQNNQDDQTNDQAIYVNQYSTSTLLSGARTCVLEIENARSAGFTISGRDPPPFTICKITKDSPAEKAGLKLNDSLLSINGKSVIAASYEKTIQIVKDALIEQKTIPIVVNQLPSTKRKQYHSVISTGDELSDAQSIDSTNATDESNPRSKNAVEQYQRM